MRKFSTILENSGDDKSYEVTVCVRLALDAANEGEAVFLAEMAARGLSPVSTEVTDVTLVAQEKNNEVR